MDRLQRELQERGTAEVVNGEVLQVTQALDETQCRAKFIAFGELRDCSVKPIAEACASCIEWMDHGFNSTTVCQHRQAEDARKRGFTKVICPCQFEEGG